MSEYAFISDLHSNLEALQAVEPHLMGMKVIALGDIVGYGADPAAVVSWVRKNTFRVVQGNHDYAVAMDDYGWLNSGAAEAARWTRKSLHDEDLMFLRNLQPTQRIELDGYRVLIVHGSPEDPLHEYVFPQTHESLFDYYLEKYDCDIIAMGHTHFPFSFKSKKGLLFNPGSVGQPRDGDPRSSIAVLELGGTTPTVKNIRIEYEVEVAAKKIITAGLPVTFCNRLFVGH